MADFDIGVTMTGLDSVMAKLQAVKYDVAKKGGRFALRKAAQVMVKAAQQNAQRLDDPETAADIAKNIVERWNGRLNKATGDLGFRVGVQGGAGGNKKASALDSLPGHDTRHWRYVEFGTEKTAAQSFFVPAFKANLQAATTEFIVQYGAALDRAIRKAGKSS
jgi:HK97 gp10 family phage protein